MSGPKLPPHRVDSTGATAGDVLTFDGTDPVWDTPAGGSYTDPLTTKGDLVVRTSSTTTRKGVGSDGQVLIADSSQADGVRWGTTSSGSAESFEDVVSALPSKVHRWKFNEASGATVADSIGSLNLTLSGTYTRAVAGLVGAGSATTFGASAKAVSSGLGSLPTGANPRCLIAVYRVVHTSGKSSLVSYGPAGSTRQWFTLFVHESTSISIQVATWADDMTVANTLGTDDDWHVAAIGYNGSTSLYAYIDGQIATYRLGATLNTGTSGNFQVGLSTNSDGQFGGEIDEIIATSSWPGRSYLDRIARSLGRLG